MTEEFYIGQIFYGTYPEGASNWCNNQDSPYITIEEIEPQDGERVFKIVDITPTPEEQAQKERERLNLLSMTRGDMFEAIILAFGKTKADIRSMIENVEDLTDIERALYLNRFDEALDFYRGYPAVDLIGKMLGVSSEQLDKFFETKDYTYLLPSDQVDEGLDVEN